jgi:hypothetical protein
MWLPMTLGNFTSACAGDARKAEDKKAGNTAIKNRFISKNLQRERITLLEKETGSLVILTSAPSFGIPILGIVVMRGDF